MVGIYSTCSYSRSGSCKFVKIEYSGLNENQMDRGMLLGFAYNFKVVSLICDVRGRGGGGCWLVMGSKIQMPVLVDSWTLATIEIKLN